MIPQHVLDDLVAGQRVAVLARHGELHFLVHEATADATLSLVAGRERDVGGEG